MHSKIKNAKTNTMISTIKLGSLFVVCTIFLKSNFSNQQILNNYSITLRFIITFFAILLLVMTYYIWSTIWIKKLKEKALNIAHAIEFVLFFLLYSYTIIYTGMHESPYKVLFLFMIIPLSIQYGFKFGITSALSASFFIFIIDFIYGVNGGVNVYIENDFIISSIFVIISWFLSYYVKLEKEHTKALEDRANLDSLTGLYNHRFFHDRLKELFETPEPKKKIVSLIFLDIDYFKEYNDMYGHLSGDEVLKEISFILKENASGKHTTVCRYGGDEFAIILNNKSESQTVALAEEVRQSFEEAQFEGQEHLPSGNLTASIGIALYNENMKSYPELIKCADDALYRAKFINKNKVEVYSSVFDMIKNDIEEEHFDLIASIKTLISVINAKDKYTYGHVERVVIYVKMFAEELELSDCSKKTLIYSAYMHDIGKINIPEVVLNKKMPLDDEEWNMIKQHPQNGAEIVNKVESLSNTAPIIKHHHERYDGKGYPDGLKGKEIPYLSRILTIVDSFDAMTFSRPYKPAMTFAQATEELEKCSGTQFDPELAKVFIRTIKNLKSDSDSYVPQNKDDYLMHHPK